MFKNRKKTYLIRVKDGENVMFYLKMFANNICMVDGDVLAFVKANELESVVDYLESWAGETVSVRKV